MTRTSVVVFCFVGAVAVSAVAVCASAAEPCCAKDGWLGLFQGDSLDGWQNARNPQAANKWSVEDGAMTNKEHGNDIATKQEFKDFCLKLEYKTVKGGNSGVYLRGRVELQVLDSFGKEKVGAGDDGGVYGLAAPLVNASKPAGEWNTLEVSFVGDVLTATLNGKVIHDRLKVEKVTGGALPGALTDPGPLMLQGDHGKVWYRNIMIKPCAEACAQAATCCPAKKAAPETK